MLVTLFIIKFKFKVITIVISIIIINFNFKVYLKKLVAKFEVAMDRNWSISKIKEQKQYFY